MKRAAPLTRARVIPLLAALLAASAPALARQAVQHPFPMDVTAIDQAAGTVQLAPNAAARGALESLGAVVLTGVALPNGEMVDLELTRAGVERLDFGFRVDGQPVPDLLDSLDLTVWMGRVVGEPGSNVALSFSGWGDRGWIQRNGTLVHLLARPGAGGDWTRSVSQWVDDGTLLQWGNSPPPTCLSDAIPPGDRPPLPEPPGPELASWLGLSQTLYLCSVAVETDDQLYGVFNNDLNAMTTYVTTLLTWVSYRFEEQVSIVLTFPYIAFYTQGNDPWVSGDNNAGSIAMLFEFKRAWRAGRVPYNASLGAFLAGSQLGGGVAWLPGVCLPGFKFSVSGNLAGSVQFPVQQSAANWDFHVVAHELGHNMGAPHTHDICPPVDSCWTTCQGGQICSQGTIMSYCHLCPGGEANIIPFYHAQNVTNMQAWAHNNCLPLYIDDPLVYCTAKTNSQGCTPSIDAVGHPTISGIDDFHVTASGVINQKSGILFWAVQPASAPFQGGTKCVGSPTRRTPLQASGGNNGPDDCSGSYDFHFAHAYLAASGLKPGTTVFAQFWSRDPASTPGSGLTDALEFTVAR